MRRRDFLAAIPCVVGATVEGGPATAATHESVALIPVGTRHPRVLASLRELRRRLLDLGLRVEMLEDSSRRAEAGGRIFVGTATEVTLSELRRLGRLDGATLKSEHFELRAVGPVIFALGGDDRGAVYAVSELIRFLDSERELPRDLLIKKRPLFPVRRWSTAVSHPFGSPWDERVYVAQRFSYIRSEIFPRAAEYGMNSIELNGRPADGWDIDWVIAFENYPKLAALYPAEERRARLALVENLARSAHENLLDFLVWTHELHLPGGFLELYPQARGTNYPVCPSNEFLRGFIRDKYREFFSAAPSVDGVIVSVNESDRFSLFTDRGCQCDRCARLQPHQRIRQALDEVVAVGEELGKQVVLRTFQSAWIRSLYSHPELKTVELAYQGLPPQVRVMSKYCPLDFYGVEIPDEPLIGAFPNPSLIEFSLDVEWQGRTFVPALTHDNFRRRIAHALDKKCVGVVGRVDFPFPMMEPEPIFGHPNEFNARHFGELLWSPQPTVDDSMRCWAKARYGARAADAVGAALLQTEEITQKTFFTFGHTAISYHNMLAAVSFADNALWNHALSKWDPEKRAVSEGFFDPSDDFIARARREKKEAEELAARALERVLGTRDAMPKLENERLRYDFEKLRDTAMLWAELIELYLRHRQTASSPPEPGRLKKALSGNEGGSLWRLLAAAAAALRKAVEMEFRYGKASWPVISPDRGVSVYEFANQILRHYISAVTGEEIRERVTARYGDTVLRAAVYEPDSVESLWRGLVEFGRPGVEVGSETQLAFAWPKRLERLRLDGQELEIRGEDGSHLRLPLPYPVRALLVRPSSRVELKVHKLPGELLVEKVEVRASRVRLTRRSRA